MRRKALLMGMAVMTSLPGGVLAKGPGKHDRMAHPYAGAWGSEYSIDLGEGIPGLAGAADAAGLKVTALISRIGNLLGGPDNSADDEPSGAAKGWSVELASPAASPDLASGLRPARGLNLGLAFRFTF